MADESYLYCCSRHCLG
ncbi:hypothetical protein SPV_2471 [Streptococcus pneumoniae]|nr:hypothetical protein SPV_2471 [Streptococcus pneumoniae]